MAFHNVSLPDAFQYGSTFGSGFTTVIQTTSTGHEYRLARQSQARHRYRLLKLLQSGSEALALKTFALARRGALHSFRLKDWSDFTSNDDGQSTPTILDQVIGVGDGARQVFQLIKTYDESGDAPYARPIQLPVAGSVVAAVAGFDVAGFFSVSGGEITLAAAPGIGDVVTAGFSFDVPVRFGAEVDTWNALRADAYNVWSLEQMECVEVLDEVEWPELWNPGGVTNHGAVSQDISINYIQGELHTIAPSTAIDLFLPAPDQLVGGPRHFVIIVAAGAAGTVQVRADDGTAVGSPIAAGVGKRVGCAVGSSTFTWVLY